MYKISLMISVAAMLLAGCMYESSFPVGTAGEVQIEKDWAGSWLAKEGGDWIELDVSVNGSAFELDVQIEYEDDLNLTKMQGYAAKVDDYVVFNVQDQDGNWSFAIAERRKDRLFISTLEDISFEGEIDEEKLRELMFEEEFAEWSEPMEFRRM